MIKKIKINVKKTSCTQFFITVRTCCYNMVKLNLNNVDAHSMRVGRYVYYWSELFVRDLERSPERYARKKLVKLPYPKFIMKKKKKFKNWLAFFFLHRSSPVFNHRPAAHVHFSIHFSNRRSRFNNNAFGSCTHTRSLCVYDESDKKKTIFNSFDEQKKKKIPYIPCIQDNNNNMSTGQRSCTAQLTRCPDVVR